jgi:hypothetical protein
VLIAYLTTADVNLDLADRLGFARPASVEHARRR